MDTHTGGEMGSDRLMSAAWLLIAFMWGVAAKGIDARLGTILSLIAGALSVTLAIVALWLKVQRW